MPEMQEIRSIIGYGGEAACAPVVGVAPHLSTPTTPQSTRASEENLMASPGTTTDGTLSSVVGGDSSPGSRRTTPAASRRNSRTRHLGRHQQHSQSPPTVGSDNIELADVHQGRFAASADVGGGSVDADTLSQTLDTAGNRIVTMTGTIKRGRKVEDTVQVELKLSQNEINKLTESYMEEAKGQETSGCCALRAGLHIAILTVLFMPIAFIISLSMSFYLGTQAWYNLYLYLSEERTIWHNILLCPLLILLFPFLIVLLSLGLGLYGMVVQLSWFLARWLRELRDPEKGFYGWLFGKLRVPQCAPYQIVILDEAPVSNQTPAAGLTNL